MAALEFMREQAGSRAAREACRCARVATVLLAVVAGCRPAPLSFPSSFNLPQPEAFDRVTGTRLGYHYHARADQRLRAVHAWRRYLQQQAEAEAAADESGVPASEVAGRVDSAAVPPGQARGTP